MVFRSIILLLILIPGRMFFFPSKEWSEHHINGEAQGTTYHITYYAKGKVVYKTQIDSLLKQVDHSLSIYDPKSLISQFNRSKTGVKADFHLKKVIKESLVVNRKTGGIFDITVFPLMAAWGFGLKPVVSSPDSNCIESIMKYVGSHHLKIRKNWLTKDLPQVSLDVNGIAQGYSVDLVANFLEQRGICNYLVEIGGEIRIHGRKQPDAKPFKIGIEAPAVHQNDAELIKRILEVGHGAITTSGNYRNYHLNKGRKIAHLLDARTGYPINNELIAVTVWAPDAIIADGYDNALMGMGLKRAINFVKKQKHMEAYFIYRNTLGVVSDTCTMGFLKFLK